MTEGKRFNKDAWIRVMIRNRYIKVDRDGTINRAKWCDKDGKTMSDEYAVAKPRVHKKSGRVYLNITYMGFTKSALVNRVVALAYLPNPLNLPQVNHIDGDKEHNALINLEWATGHDNEKHAHRTGLKTGRGSQNSNAKLSANQVIEIRASTASPNELAEQYGVARSTIVNILNRTTWRHL